MLKDEPHAALLRWEIGDVPAMQQHAPAVGCRQAGDHA